MVKTNDETMVGKFPGPVAAAVAPTAVQVMVVEPEPNHQAANLAACSAAVLYNLRFTLTLT